MLFTEIATVVAFAAMLGIIMIWLKQPSVLGYIAAGFLLSTTGYITAASADTIETLASIGIALLLFLVGLEMNFDKVKHLGWHIIVISLVQTAVTIGLAVLLLQALGWTGSAAVYLALALSFSSTIIAVKFLTEKKDMSSTYGQIIVGVMLIEDFMAIIALILAGGLSTGAASGATPFLIGTTLVKGVGLFAGAILISRIMPRLLKIVGTKAETIFLFSIAWGIGVAALISSKWIGMGIEAGGFIAGLAFARSAEHYEITSKIRWLRDFFIVLFFVLLGSKMVVEGGIVQILPQAIIISLFVLIVTPIVTAATLIRLGYDVKTAVLAGLMTGQISEFSMVVAARGAMAGYLSQNDVGLITVVGIVTIVFSSFFITHAEVVYKFLKKPLHKISRKKSSHFKAEESELSDHIIIIGAHRLGQGLIRSLKAAGQKIAVIDFDRQTLKKLESADVLVLHGDGTDPETLSAAGINRARLLISTVPLTEDNAVIYHEAKGFNPHLKIVLTANSEWEGRELYELGADYVIMPHFLSGEHLGEILRKESWHEEITGLRKANMESLSVPGV